MFIIRHKESRKQVWTSNGKKGAWKTIGHAKSAFANLGRYQWQYAAARAGFTLPEGWKQCYFDTQDVFEIVEFTGDRWCFRQDDDGHNYLIPLDRASEFAELLDSDDFEKFWDAFDEHRCDSVRNFSFTNPKEF